MDCRQIYVVAAIVWIVFETNAIAQQTHASVEQVVVAAPELGLTNASEVNPEVLGLIGDFRKIDTVMPNVSIGDAGADSFEDVYAVRGLNNTPNFSKQALTVYIDDVPSASTFTNFTDLGTLESTELVRGPQGDLVGKNAEAGLLEIRTISPDQTRLIVASVARANYDYWNENVLVSGPLISNTLFAKFEGGYLSRDGYLENSFLHTRPDFQQHAFGRIQLRLTPTPEWEISFSSEYHYIRDGVQRFVPLTLPDPFRVAFNFDGRTDIDGNIEAVRIAGTFDWVRVMLITSWRQWNLDPYTADFDYSPVPIIVGKFDLHQTQIATELRLESIESQPDLHWLIGLFGDSVTNDGSEAFAIDPILKLISFDENETEVAVFGQITRHFTNGFSLTLGMRVDYDENRITRQRTVTFQPKTQFGSNSTEWNIQPKLVAAYEVMPDSRIYFSSAYGYRNGGFSFLETDPRLASYDPERVWANEIGVRANVCNHSVQIAGAAFVNHVEDYQVEHLSIPPDISVSNAPLVISYGGEIEIVAKPFSRLDVKGTFGCTHSQFVDFNDPITGANLSGKRTPFSPDWTAALLMRYSQTGFFVESELLATGQTFYDEANTQLIRQAPHAQFNARVGYQNAHMRMYLYAENLNDAVYFTQKIAYAGIGAPALSRTVGFAFQIQM